MRPWINIIFEAQSQLPESVITAFKELGDLQRHKPEHAMLKVQGIYGGGVLAPVVEHVGDITHRMTHMVGYGTVLGYEKIVKTHRWLTNAYGFEREMQGNIKANARYRKIDPHELSKQIRAALHVYAHEHAKLPVYNKAQWLARQAAIFLGMERFKGAADCLKMLLSMAPNEQAFHDRALEYKLNDDGTPRPFTVGGK
jgi:hypothetical protein